MAKSKDIMVIPFSLLKRDMFPQYTRDEFRKVIRKAPMLVVGGKLYVKKALQKESYCYGVTSPF